MRCTACGGDNRPGRRFCCDCGTPLPVVCGACSADNEPTARFCGDCGTPLADAAPPRPGGLAEAEPRSWPAAERRQLTLLFCDLCGSTALSDRLDPEDMREVLESYRARCAAALARYGGTVAYYMGDGILAYFGYPTAHEDDALRAVRAALEIVPAVAALGTGWPWPLPLPLRVRISIHTGLVVAGEISLDSRRNELWAVGRAPNIAARLQSLATPDAIVVSEATHRLLHGVFVTTSLGRHQLPGIDETIEVLRIESEQPVGTAVTLDVGAHAVALVNREAELAALAECWAAAQLGAGRAVLLSGEPGIGKSRLVRALVAGLPASTHQVLLFQCSPYFIDSPLHPVIEQIERAAGIAQADGPATRLERLDRLVGSLREQLPDLVETLADLLGIEQDRYRALAALASAEKRLRTFATLTEYVLRLAATRPMILFVEDLHWADPTTREWLGLLIDRLRAAPVLALLAFRPDYQPPWADAPGVVRLPLDRLGREHSEALVAGLTEGRRLPVELTEQILAATDGVPLFVEELTKSLLESDLLGEENGRSVLRRPLPPVDIPATIQDSLMARLDRLGEGKWVAQVAATIGREFSRALLGAVAEIPPAALQASLDSLVAAGLAHALGASGSQYAFKHALVRDAAYNSLLRSTCRRLHGRIVAVLEARFPSLVAANPELAAQHCTEARLYDQAAGYWLQAGRQAIRRSANVEAVSHLEHGLAAVRALPEGAATAARRLEHLVTLGPPLLMTRGPGAPVVEQIYGEALDLCEQVPPTLDHVAAFWGWWRISQGNAAMLERAERLLSTAERLAAPPMLLQAHHCLWATRFNLGDLEGSWRHIEAGLALYRQGDYSAHADYFGGHDARVCGSGEAALVRWHLGEPERALRFSLDALEWAERLGHAGSRLHALDIAVTFRRYRREPEPARALALRMIELGHQLGLADHLAKGRLYLGWTVAAAGQHQEGLAMIEEAFGIERESGTPEDFAIYSDILAETLVLAGRTGAALDEAERAIADTEERAWPLWLPELHRRRGEILLALSAPRADEAEACFGEALTLARNQGSKSLELRAACSLARLWRRGGRRDAARQLLGEIYYWFGEGVDTPDLRDARRELDALGVQRLSGQPARGDAAR